MIEHDAFHEEEFMNLDDYDRLSPICIGCGCDPDNPCWDDEFDGPCNWVRIDREAGLGVCSACRSHVNRWDDGNRKQEEE